MAFDSHSLSYGTCIKHCPPFLEHPVYTLVILYCRTEPCAHGPESIGTSAGQLVCLVFLMITNDDDAATEEILMDQFRLTHA